MSTEASKVVALATLQFAVGGLCDSTPTDYLIHLVRSTDRGTPGPTLCDIDRFATDAPGWSVRGGVDGPGMAHTPCAGCVEVARRDFPGLPVNGMRALSAPMTEALGAKAVTP